MARRRLGLELRRLREEAGLSGQQLADSLGWSQAKVSRLEAARVRTTVEDIARALATFDLPPRERDDLLELAEEAAGPPESWRNSTRAGLTRRQQDLIALISAAVSVRHYNPLILPGIVQAPAYARRILEMTGHRNVERSLEERMAQRAILTGERPPRYEILVADAAIRWRPGPPTLMAKQLGLVLDLTALGSLTLRILPTDQEQASFLLHPVRIYDFGGDPPTEVRVETTTTDYRITDPEDVEIYSRRFTEVASRALTPARSIACLKDTIRALTRESR
jgi:transcriptional regulator with XRE-family HTH domain